MDKPRKQGPTEVFTPLGDMPGLDRDIFEEEDLDSDDSSAEYGGDYGYAQSMPVKITRRHLAEVQRWYEELRTRAENWSHSDFGAYVATVAGATGLPLSSLTLMPGNLLQDFEPFSFDVLGPSRRKKRKMTDFLDEEAGDTEPDMSPPPSSPISTPPLFAPSPEPEEPEQIEVEEPPAPEVTVKTETAAPTVQRFSGPTTPQPPSTPVSLLTPAPLTPINRAPPRASAAPLNSPEPMTMGEGRSRVGGAPNRHVRPRSQEADVYAGYFTDYAEAAARDPEIRRRMQIHHQFRNDINVMNLMGNPMFQRDPARVLKTPHLQGWEATAMMRIKQSSYGSHLRTAKPEHFYHDPDARTAFANLVALCVREAETAKGTQLSQAYPFTLPAMRQLVFACTSCIWAGPRRSSYLVRDWDRYHSVQHQANRTKYIPQELKAAPRYSQSTGRRPQGRGALTTVFF